MFTATSFDEVDETLTTNLEDQLAPGPHDVPGRTGLA